MSNLQKSSKLLSLFQRRVDFYECISIVSNPWNEFHSIRFAYSKQNFEQFKGVAKLKVSYQSTKRTEKWPEFMPHNALFKGKKKPINSLRTL